MTEVIVAFTVFQPEIEQILTTIRPLASVKPLVNEPGIRRFDTASIRPANIESSKIGSPNFGSHDSSNSGVSNVRSSNNAKSLQQESGRKSLASDSSPTEEMEPSYNNSNSIGNRTGQRKDMKENIFNQGHRTSTAEKHVNHTLASVSEKAAPGSYMRRAGRRKTTTDGAVSISLRNSYCLFTVLLMPLFSLLLRT